MFPHLPEVNCASPLEMRNKFWSFWMTWKTRAERHEIDLVCVADCGTPVESNFLSACIHDDLKTRAWEGPTPLHELGTFLFAMGCDPWGTYDRLPNEMPVHNALCDARQSARLWLTLCNYKKVVFPSYSEMDAKKLREMLLYSVSP